MIDLVIVSSFLLATLPTLTDTHLVGTPSIQPWSESLVSQKRPVNALAATLPQKRTSWATPLLPTPLLDQKYSLAHRQKTQRT
jgi:hypothetical protein